MKGLPLLFSMMLANCGRGNKLLPHQVYEFTRLYIRQGFSPLQYYSYGWCRDGVSIEDSRGYLSRRTYWAMQGRLNRAEWEAVANNKWLFYLHMRLMGLPVPACYGYFDRINGSTSEGEPLRDEDDLHNLISGKKLDSFVVKPACGGMGRDVLVLHRVEKGYESLDGRVFTDRQLADLMSREPYIVQERVIQCEGLNRINPFTVNTCRLVTFVDGEGEPHIHLAALRTGRKGHNTDNAHTGGVSCVIDVGTGTLGMGKSLEGQPSYQVHPDSGFDLTGQVVPDWESAKSLALSAARVCPLGAVGWDIVLSDRGPVLLEVNAHWAYRQPQARAPYFTEETRGHLSTHGIEQR